MEESAVRFVLPLLLTLCPGLLQAAETPKPNSLTPQEIADGWVLLFDGETLLGWNTEGEVTVRNGVLTIGGSKPASAVTTSEFGYCKVAFDIRPSQEPPSREGA